MSSRGITPKSQQTAAGVTFATLIDREQLLGWVMVSNEAPNWKSPKQ